MEQLSTKKAHGALPLLTSELRHANPAYPRPMTAFAENGALTVHRASPPMALGLPLKKGEFGASRWQLDR
jgi:hypothetical protein